MSTHDQLQQWLSHNFDPSDVVEIRRIPNKDNKNLRIVSTWHQSHEVPPMVEKLIADNAAGWNIYAGANPRPRQGVTGNANIKLARAIFADFDHTAVDVAQRRVKAVGLPDPSMWV